MVDNEKSARNGTVKPQVERALVQALESLGLDLNSPHLRDTPKRMAAYWCDEICQGVGAPRPRMTAFENTQLIDQLHIVGPITVRSTCAHHFAPIMGHCWIGILPAPDGKLLGLSKYVRLVRHVMSRPSVQEESTQVIADELQSLLQPKGLGVRVIASHACMTMRGVCESHAKALTQEFRGTLLDNPSARAEFLEGVKAL